jgi:hypothetical protein
MASSNLSRSIHHAFGIYDSIRRPLANAVMEWSRTNGRLGSPLLSFEFDGIKFDSIGDEPDSKMNRDEMIENLQKRMRMAQEISKWCELNFSFCVVLARINDFVLIESQS